MDLLSSILLVLQNESFYNFYSCSKIINSWIIILSRCKQAELERPEHPFLFSLWIVCLRLARKNVLVHLSTRARLELAHLPHVQVSLFYSNLARVWFDLTIDTNQEASTHMFKCFKLKMKYLFTLSPHMWD